MERQTRIALGLAAAVAAATLYPCFASAQIAPPTASAIPGASPEIPFELFRNSRIVLTGRVNGVETPMLFDSGAGVTTLDDDFARKIGLKPGTRITAQGAGGGQEGELIRNVTVEAGNLKLSGVTVLVLDLAPIEKAIGRPIPAVLGHEVFMNSVVALDFDRKLLTLSPSQGFEAPAGATEVKLRRSGTAHYFPVSIDGLPPIEADLDLGNGGALSLSREYVKTAPKLMQLPYAVGLSGGVGGLHENRKVTLPELSFAGFDFRDVPADLGSVTNGPYAGKVNAGIQLFKPFKLTLDLGHDRLWLQRTNAPAVFPKDRVGLFLSLEADHFNVLHVAPGSPADKAGIKKGDQLVSIDGNRVGPGIYGSLGEWTKAAAGTEATIAKADGQTVKLMLADYY